jgi:succinate dehydrogenase / fumarate reductase iron-sulfur subunit
MRKMDAMVLEEVTFRILRYKPGVIDPARFQTHQLAISEQSSVLDALEQLRLLHEPTLVYRHSCHHGSCGTCACIINGTERLACTTKVGDLEGSVVTVEPLNGFEPIADLAVRIDPLFQEISPDWTYLQPVETAGNNSLSTINAPHRFENCIECGSCVSACPVSQAEGKFIGPAALAAIHREMLKTLSKKKELLKIVGGPRGERWCRRALACSRVCPTKVYPARHIADLRKVLKKRSTTRS